MTQPIVLKSLDELGQFGDRFAATEQTNNDRPMLPVTIDLTPELDLALPRRSARSRPPTQTSARRPNKRWPDIGGFRATPLCCRTYRRGRGASRTRRWR